MLISASCRCARDKFLPSCARYKTLAQLAYGFRLFTRKDVSSKSSASASIRVIFGGLFSSTVLTFLTHFCSSLYLLSHTLRIDWKSMYLSGSRRSLVQSPGIIHCPSSFCCSRVVRTLVLIYLIIAVEPAYGGVKRKKKCGWVLTGCFGRGQSFEALDMHCSKPAFTSRCLYQACGQSLIYLCRVT